MKQRKAQNLKKEQGEQKVHKLLQIIFIMVLFCSSIIPSFAFEGETIPITSDISQGEQLDLIQDEVQMQDPEIKPLDTKKIQNTVVPNPKKEGRKVLILFFKAILAVIFCSIAIYYILFLVKKFYASPFVNTDVEEFENLNLSSPNDKQEALRSFLNRSK